jgi:hypothetical protein
MSNPNAPQHPARDQYEVIAPNRGSSRAGDSPEQVQLDMIYNFKFLESLGSSTSLHIIYGRKQ